MADVFVDRQKHIPAQLFNDFLRELRLRGVSIELHESESRTFSGIEHYLPTAVVIFIAAPFVRNFLSEAGKDAYKALKRIITALFRKIGAFELEWFSVASSKSMQNPLFTNSFDLLPRRDGTSIQVLGRTFIIACPLRNDTSTTTPLSRLCSECRRCSTAADTEPG